MAKPRAWIVALLFTGCMSACASLDVTLFDRTYPATQSVDVVTSRSSISQPYTELGFVNITGRVGLTGLSDQDLLDRMKQKAMSCGANAIILDSLSMGNGHALMIRFKTQTQ